jgi:hypothetical protein
VSIAYDSPRELAVRTGIEPIGPAAAEGEATAARGAGIRTAGSLPANLDFRGPTPPFPVLRPRGAGALELDVRSPAAVTVEVELAEAPFAGRVLGASGEAHLRGLHLAPVDAVESVHGPRACGEYVDWYRPERLAE